MYRTLNPATGETIQQFSRHDTAHVQSVLQKAQSTFRAWSSISAAQRAQGLLRVADVLEQKKEEFAGLITLEMGKLIKESRSEIEKCAWGCRYYAEQAAEFLQPHNIETDASRSFVVYQPLGVVLAIMPWNFPFWQVFRFAAPALAAGNCALLKHASNVPQCALAIERIFQEAGLPQGVFSTLLIDSSEASDLIANPVIAAVTLTGSESAGRQVGARAGQHLKKSVLELGGSDAFIVLDDADVAHTVAGAVQSRFLNCGQSCIAAKRFIVVGAIAERFLQAFTTAVEQLRPGDPFSEQTQLAPMARADLREEVHRQVQDALAKGAVAVTGCRMLEGTGFHYAASILDRVQPGMRVYTEEVFGPVALVIRVKDEMEAVTVANDSRFGLGGSVWSRDSTRAQRLALQLQCGSAFVNGIVKSDPRLPFGGVKDSGYGRELSMVGMHEFVNIKTVWVK